VMCEHCTCRQHGRRRSMIVDLPDSSTQMRYAASYCRA
jgi:hypothetical protein